MSTQALTSGSVFRLPALAAGDWMWRLPISTEAAPVLLAVLCEADRELRSSQLKQLLAWEPSLALWVAARLFSDSCPTGLSALADGLAPEVTTALDGTGMSADAAELATPEQVAKWSGLSQTSVARARAAEAICAERFSSGDLDDTTVSLDRVTLFALLSQAVEWLDSCGPHVSWTDCRAGRSCLPEWLIRFLHDLKAKKNSPLVHLVAESAVASAAGSPASDDVGCRWELPGDRSNLTAVLPQVVARLARLQQLESDFARQLEEEKLASLYWLAYGASHEINNPLANISTRAQSLLRDEKDPERKRMLATINSQAFRAHEMINDLMLFAHPPEIARSEVDADQLLQEAIDEILPAAGQQGTEIVGHWEEGPHWIQVDPEHLVVALQALLKNALEALGGGGRIDVTADWGDTSSASEQKLQIEVSDTGPGIPPEVRRHLFDPFFSGREAGRGLGMGLSKCWRIVHLHGGQIEVAEGHGGGTTFRIELPR